MASFSLVRSRERMIVPQEQRPDLVTMRPIKPWIRKTILLDSKYESNTFQDSIFQENGLLYSPFKHINISGEWTAV